MKICKRNVLFFALYLILGLALSARAQEDGASLVKTGTDFAQKALRSEDEKARQDLFKSAMACFIKAAKLKYGEGYYKIGWMLFSGHGVEQNRKKCIEFYKKAIKAGYIDACYSIGLVCASDRLGERDIPEAVKWFKLSAERGNPDAMGFLGRWYFTGKAGEKSYVKSRFYYGTIVKILGAENAGGIIEIIARLERVMTTAQIEEAQKLVEQYTPATTVPSLD
ncbi:MAG TPA: tetratricopeptide repeat protein [Candidatus Rifleibacterium sp.]|nr:tetratricopeptide repeat protein [Candidatus Rifleibacterium sp.]HPT46658.1 tetratricopeptide repeat protein [Candidatus Rifleibacterium sp.]